MRSVVAATAPRSWTFVLHARNSKLAERVAAVDEQPSASGGCHGDALKSLFADFRVTTIEGADPDCEDDVVPLFVGSKDEVFDRNATDAHAARGDLLGCGGAGVGDCGCGPIDGEDVAGNKPGGDCSCRRARPATNLEDPGIAAAVGARPRLQ